SDLPVLQTLAELGPLALSGRDFHESSRVILDRILTVLEVAEGAVCSFDENTLSMTCPTRIGLPKLPKGVSIRIGGVAYSLWSQLREPGFVSQDSAARFFGASPRERFEGIECVHALRNGPHLLGALLLGGRTGKALFGERQFTAMQLLSSPLSLLLQNFQVAEALRVQITDNLRLLSQLQHAQDEALVAFATTIDSKNQFMRGHSIRVARYAAAIGQSLGVPI